MRAALRADHEIIRVFFYHDGVYNSIRSSVPPIDDRHVTNQWVALAEKHNLDLTVCVAAGQRRGMLDDSEARRHGKECHTVDERFRIAGVGQFIEGAILADRTVVFGD